jgi:hypothetical protein
MIVDMEADISKVSAFPLRFDTNCIGYVILTIPDNLELLGNVLLGQMGYLCLRKLKQILNFIPKCKTS